MNPTQYKEAMRQRALGRRAELERAEALPRRSLGITHPPLRDPSSPAARAGQRGVVPKLQVQVDDSEGGSEATSFASAIAGGGSVEGRSEHDQLGDLLLLSSEDGLSPLAPGPLADHWSGRGAQLAGFDRQADSNSNSSGSNNNDSSGSMASPGDVWGEEDGDAGFVGERQQQQQHQQHQHQQEQHQQEQQQQQQRRRRGVRVLDWDDKLPGETSITQAVRLYLSNLYEDASHEDNCALFLHQILERVAAEELDLPRLKTRHTIKIEAFLRSVVLSVPAKTWQQSVRGAFARTAPSGMSMTMSISPGHGHQAQITKEELTFRMTLFVAMMTAEKAGTDEADLLVDALRVESVVRGYAANAAEILPLQRPARTLLPPLLFCMACEVLHVRLLAPEVRHVCRQIVSDYEARAKLWMSPNQNAERFLLPLVTEFASWLRANRDILYQGSATEGLLRSIDQGLRSSLKTQVYQSPEHFLEVLQSLSSRLTDMPLPSYDPSGGDDHPFDISQTLKDVSRERFYVNKEPTEPSRCWSTIRALLLDAAESSKQAPLDRGAGARPADAAALQPDTGGARVATDSAAASEVIRPKKGKGVLEAEAAAAAAAAAAEECPAIREAQAQRSPGSRPGQPAGDDGEAETKAGGAAAGGSGTVLASPVSAGSAGKAEGSRDRKYGKGDVEVDAAREGGGCARGDAEESLGATKPPFELYVDQCAWRVLHAASRTASGGDSFFVVQDLFGGEGVLVKMATAATEPIRIRTKGLAVRVTTVDKHDIYHISDVDIISEASPRPLMTITTTMKEIILFAPFVGGTSTRRKSGSTTEGGDSAASGSADPRLSATIQQQQQQQQQQLPSHARSGRFVTISADLPDYPEDHLDATAGVLHAQAPSPSPSVASMPDMEPAIQFLPQPPAANTGMGIARGDAGVSPADSDDASSVASSSREGNVLRRRPSIFNSPAPAPTPDGWKGLEMGSASGSERVELGSGSEWSSANEASSSRSGETSDEDSAVGSDGGVA